MSELVVAQKKQVFCEMWNEFLRVSPLLELDGTWPSLGSIDLLTFSVRLQPQLGKEMSLMVEGAAAYLALMAAELWKNFAERTSCYVGENGIVLEAWGVPGLAEGECVKAKVEQELRRILVELPAPYPVFVGGKRPIKFDSNILSLFGLGLFTGLAPWVEGPWPKQSVEERAVELSSLLRDLAKSSATYYSRVFPDEPLGQVAEMYLNKMIYPPLLLDENLPAVAAVQELITYFQDYKLSAASILKLAKNLSMLPDELYSSVGLTLYAALADAPPPVELIAVARSKGSYMGLLRRSILLARQRLGLKKDWVSSGILDKEDEVRFEIEKQLELIPWLCMSLERVASRQGQPSVREILIAMCNFDMAEAKLLCDKLISAAPADIEVRLQRIKLEMVAGDHERAQCLCQELFSEPDADKHPMLFNLWGLCLLQLNDAQGALKHFKASLAVAKSGTELYSDISNNMAWACILIGDLPRALEHLDSALGGCLCPVTVLLNKSHVLWRLGRDEEAYHLRSVLFRLAPSDRRVFAGLTLSPRISGVFRQ